MIYPIEVRDLLFWFAHFDLFTPKWIKHIFDEWKSVLERKQIKGSEISKRLENVRRAFPDALVENYESLIEGLDLPDEKDRHVLAAAIKTNANVIVTNDLKDFPKEYISQYGLSVKSADDCITDTIDLNQQLAVDAFRKLVLNRTSPDLDEYQVLEIFRNNGLVNAAHYLHSLI